MLVTPTPTLIPPYVHNKLFHLIKKYKKHIQSAHLLFTGNEANELHWQLVAVSLHIRCNSALGPS